MGKAFQEHVHEADIGRYCPRGAPECSRVHIVCAPHTLAAIRTCPGQGKLWYSSCLKIAWFGSCRASLDIHGQDLKGELLWARKTCIDLMQCDLHIATGEWTANLVQVSHTVSPLLTDTYLLSTLSAGISTERTGKRRDPCPEHRFIPSSHRLLTSSRVGSRSETVWGTRSLFNSAKVFGRWGAGPWLVGLYPEAFAFAGSGQNAVIQMPFLQSPHQIYLNLRIDHFILLCSSYQYPFPFLSSFSSPAHSLFNFPPNS